MNYSNSQVATLLSTSTKKDCTDTETASELSGLLVTRMETYSDMELSEGIESPNIFPEISGEDGSSTNLILSATGIISDNPVSNSAASQGTLDSRLTSPIVRPKSSTEEDRITCTLVAGPADERMVSFCNIILRRQDFWTLKSMEWLNDQVGNLACLYIP